MSTKGMSVTAARALVERLTEQGVTILVLHDFDAAGLTILGTLRGDTRRYQYRTRPNIIGLGLRLDDIEGLQSEPVFYRSKVDPAKKLRKYGASQEECEFLVKSGHAGNSRGNRVEINALSSEQLIAWLERKLEEHGVKKLIPDEETLRRAYWRAQRLAAIQQAIDDTVKASSEQPPMPDDLFDKVTVWLAEHPTESLGRCVILYVEEETNCGGVR